MPPALQQPYEDLTKCVRTTQEARELIMGLEEVLQALFSVKMTLADAMHQYIPVFASNELQKLINEKPVDEDHKADLRPLFNDIATYLRTLPHVTLTISFSPSEQVITNLSTWIKENLGSQMLLELSINRSLLGGAIIVCNGMYKDLSLKVLLENTFKTRHEEFAKLFI